MKLFSILSSTSYRYLFAAVFAGVLAGICSVGLLVLVNHVIAQGISSSNHLWMPFLGLCLVTLLSNIWSQSLLIRLSQNSVYDLRMKLSRRILSTPLKQLEKLGVHKLLATLTDDVDRITTMLYAIPTLTIDFVIITGCLIYLGWLSVPMLLIVVSFILVGIASYQFPLKHASKFLRAARENHDVLFGHLRGLAEGSKELKLHKQRREAFLSDVLGSSASSFRQASIRGLTIFAAAAGWGQLLFMILIGVLIFSSSLVPNITNEAMIGYVLVVLFIRAPLQEIIGSVQWFGRAKIALGKIEQLGLFLNQEPQPELNAEPAKFSSDRWQTLEFRRVQHRYNNDKSSNEFMLGPVSFTLNKGQILVLIGANGSGKSTLGKLITGLYEPEAGAVLLDGKRVDQDNNEAYRQLFSAVFSDYYLFDSLLGMQGDAQLDQRARQYLTSLQLHAQVEISNGVLSTTELSTGQRKRLSLLTAYLEDRPIYVFDEWASDQDPVFKNVFYSKILLDLKERGKTVVVISHDDRYFRYADRLIKLESGKVVNDMTIHG